MNKAIFTLSADKKSLRMERTFPNSASKLWQAYADPEILIQWFSPKGWETSAKRHEFVDGGEFDYVMTCVDKDQDWFGQTSSGKMIFDNINPEISFEYRDFFADEDGNVMDAMPASHSFVTINELSSNESTLVVITSYATPEALQQVLEMGMELGYSQTLDKLEILISN